MASNTASRTTTMITVHIVNWNRRDVGAGGAVKLSECSAIVAL
jgi:hypothetical protein